MRCVEIGRKNTWFVIHSVLFQGVNTIQMNTLLLINWKQNTKICIFCCCEKGNSLCFVLFSCLERKRYTIIYIAVLLGEKTPTDVS
jgi:hypothetical protein